MGNESLSCITSTLPSSRGLSTNSTGVGAFFGKLEAWAKTISATTTREYVRATAARLKELNGGKLPQLKDTARQAAVERLEAIDKTTGGSGLFEALDNEYGQLVTAELPRKLRDYVQRDREAIEHAVLENAAKYSRSA